MMVVDTIINLDEKVRNDGVIVDVYKKDTPMGYGELVFKNIY